jgi:hypothetical protein
MTELLTRAPTTARDSPDVLGPPAMALTPEARTMWVRFHHAVESDLMPGGVLSHFAPFGWVAARDQHS